MKNNNNNTTTNFECKLFILFNFDQETNKVSYKSHKHLTTLDSTSDFTGCVDEIMQILQQRIDETLEKEELLDFTQIEVELTSPDFTKVTKLVNHELVNKILKIKNQ